LNRKLTYPLMGAMVLILLDLGLSMLLQNTHPIPLTDQAWLAEAYHHPNILLYHLDALNLIIAWVFVIFFDYSATFVPHVSLEQCQSFRSDCATHFG